MEEKLGCNAFSLPSYFIKIYKTNDVFLMMVIFDFPTHDLSPSWLGTDPSVKSGGFFMDANIPSYLIKIYRTYVVFLMIATLDFPTHIYMTPHFPGLAQTH